MFFHNIHRYMLGTHPRILEPRTISKFSLEIVTFLIKRKESIVNCGMVPEPVEKNARFAYFFKYPLAAKVNFHVRTHEAYLVHFYNSYLVSKFPPYDPYHAPSRDL